MSNFVDFLLDLLEQFFGYFWSIFVGIFNGIVGMFNVPRYVEIFKEYCGEFNGLAWFLAILVVVFLVAALVGIGFAIVLLVRKYIRIRRSFVSQEELLNEVGRLNNEVARVVTEKEKI